MKVGKPVVRRTGENVVPVENSTTFRLYVSKTNVASTPPKPNQRRYLRRPVRQEIRATNHTEETDYSDDSDDVAVFRININNMTTDRSRHPLFDITIDGTPLTVMADSGSSINILEERDYNKLSPRPTLERTRIKFYPYQTETPLPVLGQFTSIVASENVHRTATFYVVKGTSGSLLSWRTSTDLELLRVVKTHYTSRHSHRLTNSSPSIRTCSRDSAS